MKPRPEESMYGQLVRSRMFSVGGSSPGSVFSSRILFSAIGFRLVYASRTVNGPLNCRITVLGNLPCFRSTLKGELFHVCHENVPITRSSSLGFSSNPQVFSKAIH